MTADDIDIRAIEKAAAAEADRTHPCPRHSPWVHAIHVGLVAYVALAVFRVYFDLVGTRFEVASLIIAALIAAVVGIVVWLAARSHHRFYEFTLRLLLEQAENEARAAAERRQRFKQRFPNGLPRIDSLDSQ